MSVPALPHQLLAAAGAGLILSAVCILAAAGGIALLNILLPYKDDKEDNSK